MSDPIYLDYNATTPVDPEVVEAMLPYLRGHFGNPSSDHLYGQRAAEAVARARGEVAGLIGAESDQVIFTGCATEANNLAIQGTARARRDRGRHLITSAVEHPSVAEPLRRLAAEGWEVTVVPVDNNGRVEPGSLEEALRPDTALVSIMHANNEVGAIQPIAELAHIARAHGVPFHTDAAQSAGKIPVDVEALGVDLLTLAGHKFYAPKGVGALWVCPGTPLEPLFAGGGQERAFRPGTENVPHLVALGTAARLARVRLEEEAPRLRVMRDRLYRWLAKDIPGLILNGHPDERLPNTLNLSFPGVDGRELLGRAKDVAASVGAACHAAGGPAGGVLGAMGIAGARARGAVRLSVGRPTTERDLERAAAELVAAWRSLTAVQVPPGTPRTDR